jgi:hypothetical protein
MAKKPTKKEPVLKPVDPKPAPVTPKPAPPKFGSLSHEEDRAQDLDEGDDDEHEDDDL